MSINISLYRNANRNNQLNGYYPLGNAPSFGGAVDWSAKYTEWIDSVRGVTATTYYVDSVSGSNANDGLSKANAFADPTAAYAVMSGGDEIVVIGNGVTITDNDLFAFNDYEHSIPSGTSRAARTIIRAETPFGVRIKFTSNSRHYNYESIRLHSAQFVLIDGFIVEWMNDAGDPASVISIAQIENILTRCIVKRDQHNAWGGFVSAPANYTLIQDVHCVGGARYGIQTGTGGSGAGGKNIVRRSIVRVDFTASNQPLAPFSHYGNNDGFLSGETEFQNCYAIDGPYINTGEGAYSYTWGGFYHPKNAFDIRHRGCGVINQGGQAGFWVTDNSNAHSYLLENCAVVAENAIKYGARNGVHANPNGQANHLTLVGVDGSDLNNGATAANTYSGDTPPDSIFNAPNGADLRYCYGTFGTVWDESGFSAITTDELWNFPYEDIIRSVFSESLPSPSGYTPSANDSQRGFCADGQTLTRYIAGYSGQSVDSVLGGLY